MSGPIERAATSRTLDPVIGTAFADELRDAV